MTRASISFAVLTFCAVLSLSVSAAQSPEKREAEKKALAPVQAFVGDWKGVGGGRGSGEAARDAWGEEHEWGWDFKGAKSALIFTAPGGRYYASGRIEPGDKPGVFTFTGQLPGNKGQEVLAGELTKEGDLVLQAATPAQGRPARITMSLVAKGARMLMTFEREVRKGQYAPFAELGLTRKGSGFGKVADMRECVVTGGTGKTAVQYKGQTYYVCCGGCLDEFNENPDKVMAAWKKSKEEAMKK